MGDRPALYEDLPNDREAIDVRSLPVLRVCGTDDPDVAVAGAEWSASGVVRSNGSPDEMGSAPFASFRGGLIVTYREPSTPQPS